MPEGAINGVLTLNFAAGAASTQSVVVKPVGLGATTFTISSTPLGSSSPRFMWLTLRLFSAITAWMRGQIW